MSYLNEIYAEMGVKHDPPGEYFKIDSRYMLLEKVLRSLPSGKFCDLGCGRGALLRQMQDHHTCYGTDFDSGAVSHCKSQGLTVEQIDLNEAKQLPFPNVTFDVIVITEVCEHLLEPENALRVVKRHLKVGGTFIVTVPNAVPLFARLKLLFGRTVSGLHFPSPETKQTGHIRFYTIESMSRLLRQEGFEISAVSGVSFRMYSRFWPRFCYWLPRVLLIRSKTAPTKLDLWLANHFPGFAPGLFFVCKRP